jgi:hypothetical protein
VVLGHERGMRIGLSRPVQSLSAQTLVLLSLGTTTLGATLVAIALQTALPVQPQLPPVCFLQVYVGESTTVPVGQVTLGLSRPSQWRSKQTSGRSSSLMHVALTSRLFFVFVFGHAVYTRAVGTDSISGGGEETDEPNNNNNYRYEDDDEDDDDEDEVDDDDDDHAVTMIMARRLLLLAGGAKNHRSSRPTGPAFFWLAGNARRTRRKSSRAEQQHSNSSSRKPRKASETKSDGEDSFRSTVVSRGSWWGEERSNHDNPSRFGYYNVWKSVFFFFQPARYNRPSFNHSFSRRQLFYDHDACKTATAPKMTS